MGRRAGSRCQGTGTNAGRLHPEPVTPGKGANVSNKGLPVYTRGVKVSAIIILIIGIISAIASIFVIVSGPLVGFAATVPGASTEFASEFGFSDSDASMSLAFVGVLLTVMGIVALVSAVLDIVMGCLGIRGANNPSKITPFWVLSIIGLVIASASGITSIVMTALSGGDLAGNLVNNIISNGASIVFSALCVFYSTKVREIAKYQGMGAHSA